MASSAPGRACPVSYRYGAALLSNEPALETGTLWVAGGLYGNRFALQSLLDLYGREPGAKALVFNGDFHWFDVAEKEFTQVDDGVREHLATRGNVETELATPDAGAGCGCGYPDFVDDGTVERSNRILEKLRETARGFPDSLKRLAGLPMHLVAEVGGERVAVVHGDADSLAGWGFSQEILATGAGAEAARRSFEQANVRVFASSHSCLPVLQGFPRGRVIANNGAAGMPNFHGTHFGLATRISLRPSRENFYSEKAGSLFVEAIKLEYDHGAWQRCFLSQWPEGSAAHRSYYGRIANGPGYRVEQARRPAAALAA